MVDKKLLKAFGVPERKLKKLEVSNEKAIEMHRFFWDYFKEDTKEIMRRDPAVLSISKEKFWDIRKVFSNYSDNEFKEIITRCPRILKRSTSAIIEILSILSEYFGENSKEIVLKEPSIFVRGPKSIREKINELKFYSPCFQKIVIEVPACICSYSKEKLARKLEIFKGLREKYNKDFLLENPRRIMFGLGELGKRLEITDKPSKLFTANSIFYGKWKG